MKKTIIALCGVAMVLGMSSCDKNVGETSSTISTGCYSLVSTPSGETYVSGAKYTYAFKQMAGTVKVGVSELNIGGGTEASFTTSEMPYGAGRLELPSYGYPVVYLFAGQDVTGKDGVKITDFSGEYTTAAVMNNDSILGKINKEYFNLEPLYMPMNNTYSVLSFKYGENTVNTFWPDLIFSANTFTSYPGMTSMPEPINSIIYRVSMNLKDSSKYTADVYIYNAKFAPEMKQTINIVLKNLPMTFTSEGYVISATNVNPVMLGENTENTKYVFNSFDLQSTDKMRAMQAAFRVAGVFSGQVTGRSILSSSK